MFPSTSRVRLPATRLHDPELPNTVVGSRKSVESGVSVLCNPEIVAWELVFTGTAMLLDSVTVMMFVDPGNDVDCAIMRSTNSGGST
eukprot:3929656-Rhodomonas_salina.1